jgi:hypothetical protein
MVVKISGPTIAVRNVEPTHAAPDIPAGSLHDESRTKPADWSGEPVVVRMDREGTKRCGS